MSISNIETGRVTLGLAHFFLWHLHSRLKKKAPALTVSQVRRLLEVVLPLKVFHADDILQLVADLQQRNHLAYLAHRKKASAQDTLLSSVVGIIPPGNR